MDPREHSCSHLDGGPIALFVSRKLLLRLIIQFRRILKSYCFIIVEHLLCIRHDIDTDIKRRKVVKQTNALFFNINLFIYLFLAVLGLGCCVRASSSCGEQGLPFFAVCGLLIEVASLVAEHRL